MKTDINEFKETSGYEIDGVWYPRVTKIVGIKAKPALYHFYASLPSFAEGERIKEQSANEGTLIHEVVQDILLGNNPEVPDEIKPSIDAFLKFHENIKIDTEKDFIERRFVNEEYKYAGTLDVLGKINGKFGILDIKTSQEIYRDYNLQTSAYMAAMITNFPKLETRWILRIDQSRPCRKCGSVLRSKGGRDKVIRNWRNGFSRNCVHEWGDAKGEVELKEFPHWHDDFHAFLGAKKLWEWENEEILKEIGYL